MKTKKKLILASASTGRAGILRCAGIDFKQVVSGVDESRLKIEAAASKYQPEQTAIRLATAKSLAVSNKYPHSFVIGADQILVCRGQVVDKPKDFAEALGQLKFFQGVAHRLISAVTISRDGETLWADAEIATLTMRALTSEDLKRYLKICGPEVLETAGAYRLEGVGVNLFDKINGDYFAILGLPLLPLLARLREYKAISS